MIDARSELIGILINAFVLFTCFPVHEFAHAAVAKLLGDDTAEREGRLTLNPIVHLDIWGTIAMLVMGFGWTNPAPVNSSNFKNRKVGNLLTALAGPAANLILSYIFMILYRIMKYMSGVSDNTGYGYLATIFVTAVTANIGLALFNLLPIPPLDGARLISARTYYKFSQKENVIAVVLILLWISGILTIPVMIFESAAISLMTVLSNWVEPVMASLIH